MSVGVNVRTGSVRDQVLRYVRIHAGEWPDATASRDDLMAAIPALSKANFSVIRPDIQRIIEEQRRDGRKTQLIKTTDGEQELPEAVPENGQVLIPHDLPKESMAAFLDLLEKARGFEKELALKEAELTAARNQQILASKRIATLKAISKEAIEAI